MNAKEECKELAETHALIMNDARCRDCEYYYQCPYMMDEMNAVVYGD